MAWAASAGGGTLAALAAWSLLSSAAADVPAPAASAVSTELLGISCPDTTHCVAVGEAAGPSSSVGLVEEGNGARWSIAATVRVPGYPFVVLRGIACVGAARCVAVGYAQSRIGTHALLVAGGRRRWARLRGAAAGSAAQLVAVSCATAASCLAVGSRQGAQGTEEPLAERWDGRSWSLAPPLGGPAAVLSQLDGVACPAPSRCAATGSGPPAGAGLAPTAAAAWWRGGRWRITPVGPALSGVACPSASLCLALGQSPGGSGAPRPVMVRSSGGGWSVVRGAPGSAPVMLGPGTLACPTPRVCVAAGARPVGSAGNETPSAARWSGGRWTAMRLPGPAGPDDALRAIACPTPAVCVAVGLYQRGPVEAGLVERWSGGAWGRLGRD